MLDCIRKPFRIHGSLNLLRAIIAPSITLNQRECYRAFTSCVSHWERRRRTLPAYVLARFPENLREKYGPVTPPTDVLPDPPLILSPTEQQPANRRSDTANEASAIKLPLTAEQLAVESEVYDVRQLGHKLVDHPSHRNNFELWWELLSYRMRHYGHQGILDIWKGMTLRGKMVSPPVEGQTADRLWGAFQLAGARNKDFLRELCDYAKRLWHTEGKRRKHFYIEVIGEIFRASNKAMKTADVIQFHDLLHKDFLRSPNDLAKLFPRAATTKTGLWIFKHLCSTVEGHQIYQHVVPYLYRGRRFDEAFEMHRFLVMRRDYPPEPWDEEQLHQYMARRDKDVDAVAAGSQSSKGESRSLMGASNHAQHSLQAIFEKLDGKKKGQFSDEFGARLFATKALSFELILTGLGLFSVKAIGPLTLRELALQADEPQLIYERLNELQEAGIDIGESKFARIVRKLAKENRADLLHDVLASDQHPDVFEDWRLQESLLAHYQAHDRPRDFDRTMAILTLDASDNVDTWNLILRAYLTRRDWTLVKKALEEMLEQQVPVTERSIVHMHQQILKPRKPGKAPLPTKDSANDVLFLIRLWQKIIQSGGLVASRLWKEPLRRLGMEGRWNNLEQTALWLASWYSQEHMHGIRQALVPRYTTKTARHLAPIEPQLPGSHKESALRKIFTPGLMQAIVEWGFIWSATSPSPARVSSSLAISHSTAGEVVHPMPWTRGISLLKQLRDGYGVVVPTSLIRRVCRLRLKQLFGPLQRSRKPRNARARARNQYPLPSFVRDAGAIWGPELFGALSMPQNRSQLVNPAPPSWLQ